MSLTWYAKRLSAMSPAEIATRVTDEVKHVTWARQRVRTSDSPTLPASLLEPRVFAAVVPFEARALVPDDVASSVIDAADRLLAGHWQLLGRPRADIVDPDWFLDVVTGRRAPQDQLAFRVPHRDESKTGNVKSLWELSRHHHLTLLASAYWLTGREEYADVVAGQLRSWWRNNPFLSGVHWTSGIELGIRLTSWVWVRRLLQDWPKVGDLFEDDPDALRQIWWHQRYLDAFRSQGSSANNHLVAEAAGLLAGSCGFPWYAESEQWRRDATTRLEQSLATNTDESGVNRELASDYHRFVIELGLVAAVEAEAAGHPLDASTWELLGRSLDVAASVVDTRRRPPQQGDGDEGRALVLDDPEDDPWGSVLGAGQALLGSPAWWPAVPTSVASITLSALVGPRDLTTRAAQPIQWMPQAGIVILRSDPGDGTELWCRGDLGPHGFLSTAAHAHADALSFELRHEGVDVLVDPGTYCYHGEPQWRQYFRSTLAHNTIEVDGVDQSVSGGPFLWTNHAKTTVHGVNIAADASAWSGEHDGYRRLDTPLVHRRDVALDGPMLTVADLLESNRSHAVRMAYHLGPEVRVALTGSVAELVWERPDGAEVHAVLGLPEQLTWTTHRGEDEPPLGWYSPRFGERVPTTTLIGAGQVGSTLLTTVLRLVHAP